VYKEIKTEYNINIFEMTITETDRGKNQIMVDGFDISQFTTSLSVHVSANEIPKVDLNLMVM
jgi:hypothetical protein